MLKSESETALLIIPYVPVGQGKHKPPALPNVRIGQAVQLLIEVD